jgi:hypothetical protein
MYTGCTWRNPLVTPLDNSPLMTPLDGSLCTRVPLTYLESLLSVWCDPHPPWSQVACKLTSPSPFPFPTPNGSPNSIVRPSKTTSRHWLHLVRNMKDLQYLYWPSVYFNNTKNPRLWSFYYMGQYLWIALASGDNVGNLLIRNILVFIGQPKNLPYFQRVTASFWNPTWQWRARRLPPAATRGSHTYSTCWSFS